MRSPKPRRKPSKNPKGVAANPDSDGERRRRIAEIAYSLGARRGFDGDTDQAREDWLEAERMVDRPKTGSLS
jgi:hypothetical protein